MRITLKRAQADGTVTVEMRRTHTPGTRTLVQVASLKYRFSCQYDGGNFSGCGSDGEWF